jgi:hypothetical protein
VFDYLLASSGNGGSPGGGVGIYTGGESLLSELVSSGPPEGLWPIKQLGTPRSSLLKPEYTKHKFPISTWDGTKAFVCIYSKVAAVRT